jgi:hypothetical protein
MGRLTKIYAGNIEEAEATQSSPKKQRTLYDETRSPETNLASSQILHALLWGKNDELREEILQKRIVSVPGFTDVETTKSVNCTHLDLERFVTKYFENHSQGHRRNNIVLPCGSNSLLVRGAYEEAYSYN